MCRETAQTVSVDNAIELCVFSGEGSLKVETGEANQYQIGDGKQSECKGWITK